MVIQKAVDSGVEDLRDFLPGGSERIPGDMPWREKRNMLIGETEELKTQMIQTGTGKPGETQNTLVTIQGGRAVHTEPIGSPKLPKDTAGFSITSPDGTQIQFGGNVPPGTMAQGKIQQKIINSAEAIARTNTVMETFDPEFLTYGAKFNALFKQQIAKWDSSRLSKDDVLFLTNYATFKASSISHLNRLLNELSGAAVSPTEAIRLKGEVPNPGSGWFDGDDPISFKAKANFILDSAGKALARFRYYQVVGMPSSLAEMERIPLTDITQRDDGTWVIKLGDGKQYKEVP